MRITLPIGKTGIPLEISEDKIPGLIEKVIPTAMKHMGSLKDMGVDLTPMIRKMFGASDPVAPAVASETPAKVNAADDEAAQLKKLTDAGYWKHSDGRLYPPDLAPKPAVVEHPVLRVCGTCKVGNQATGVPMSAYMPTCTNCQYDSTRPNWQPK